ncbi:MAG: hypothetical protein IPP88_02205 [Betaproteobacteria bacterium]|jgi:hypothetical protein|nr:hypothetical protein [Betaproteobacteria bacterium]
MKKILALLAATFAVALLGGCASMPSFGIAADRMEVVDYQKMDLIDNYAKRTGMIVIWMREPTRLVDRPAAGS